MTKPKDPETVEFCGVPLVRILRFKGGWQVQTRSSEDSEDSEDWTDINPGGFFRSRDKAIDEAPYLCGF